MIWFSLGSLMFLSFRQFTVRHKKLNAKVCDEFVDPMLLPLCAASSVETSPPLQLFAALNRPI